MRLVIIDEENNKMQVGIDGIFYGGLDGSQLAEDVHAIQWYGSAGEVEYQDATTRSITSNASITDASTYQFAIDEWVGAARQQAYDEAYDEAYAQAIAVEGTTEDAADQAGITAGNAARNAVVVPTL